MRPSTTPSMHTNPRRLRAAYATHEARMHLRYTLPHPYTSRYHLSAFTAAPADARAQRRTDVGGRQSVNPLGVLGATGSAVDLKGDAISVTDTGLWACLLA
jgi:hypothetical protein